MQQYYDKMRLHSPLLLQLCFETGLLAATPVSSAAEGLDEVQPILAFSA